jgi:hypothetical protein
MSILRGQVSLQACTDCQAVALSLPDSAGGPRILKASYRAARRVRRRRGQRRGWRPKFLLRDKLTCFQVEALLERALSTIRPHPVMAVVRPGDDIQAALDRAGRGIAI